MIIGISGYANAGKDEVGRILCENHGFVRRSVGDILLDVLRKTNPLVLMQGAEVGKWRAGEFQDYEFLKSETDARELMQRMGDSLRENFGKNCLIDAVLTNAPPNMVMTSTRHVSEADRIRSSGGLIWRVNRPGCAPVNGHVTETALDDYSFDVVLENDGSKEDLAVNIAEALRVGKLFA